RRAAQTARTGRIHRLGGGAVCAGRHRARCRPGIAHAGRGAEVPRGHRAGAGVRRRPGDQRGTAMVTTDAPRDAGEVIVGFARRLGQDGLAVPPTRVHAMLEALGELGAESLGAVYWAGRVTLCASPEDIECYDRTFAAYFSGRPPPAVRRTAVTPIYRPGAVPADPAAPGQGDDVDSPPQRLATASRIEVLRHRDLAGLTADEKAEVHRFISALTP